MFKHTMHLTQKFPAPVETVWDDLSNHQNFGKILKQKITTIKTFGDAAQPDGKGSVRKIHLPGFALEETILKAEKPHRIEYQISKNNPFAFHYGTLDFKALSQTSSQLDYKIELHSRIPFFAALAAQSLHKALSKGLQKYAEKLTR